jgi:methylmalonyl-CoA/ethylmalonyl-CoA epimerase
VNSDEGQRKVTIGRLNHVGIATPSIEKSIALYRDFLGATKIHEPFDLPPQGVRTRPTARSS